MKSLIEQLGIGHLSAEQKMSLAWELLESAASNEEPEELSDEIRAMLDRRIQMSDANPRSGMSWEQVKARALARSKARSSVQ